MNDEHILITITREELAPYVELPVVTGNAREQIEAWWLHAYQLYPEAFDERVWSAKDPFVLAIVYAWALQHRAAFGGYEPEGLEIDWIRATTKNLTRLGMEIPDTEIRLLGDNIPYLETYRAYLGWSGWAFTEVPELSNHILYSQDYLEECREQARADNIVSLLVHEQLHCALVERTGRSEMLEPLVLAVEEGAVSLLDLVVMLTRASGELPYDQVVRYAASEGYHRQVALLLELLPEVGFAEELVELATANRSGNKEATTTKMLNAYAASPRSVDEWRECFGSAAW